MTGKDIHISYGTVSRDDAKQRLQSIPQFVRESDKERTKDEPNVRAEVQWTGQTCVRIKLRKNSFCWYELITVDVEDRAKWKFEENDADKGGDKKRRKREVEEAVGEDMYIFEDEDDRMNVS